MNTILQELCCAALLISWSLRNHQKSHCIKNNANGFILQALDALVLTPKLLLSSSSYIIFFLLSLSFIFVGMDALWSCYPLQRYSRRIVVHWPYVLQLGYLWRPSFDVFLKTGIFTIGGGAFNLDISIGKTMQATLEVPCNVTLNFGSYPKTVNKGPKTKRKYACGHLCLFEVAS